MARLAIKGHETRGKEVIEILGMLGGRNTDNNRGTNRGWFYFVNDFREIDWFHEATTESEFIPFILEEFLEKFPYKVGDKVIRTATHETHIIEYMTSTGYLFKNEGGIGFIFEDENLYELVPNKFDITTLKPFDKVLVRDSDKKYWSINFFGFYNEITEQFHCLGNTEIGWDECIPYEVNKELLGTTNNPKEYGSE